MNNFKIKTECKNISMRPGKKFLCAQKFRKASWFAIHRRRERAVD